MGKKQQTFTLGFKIVNKSNKLKIVAKKNNNILIDTAVMPLNFYFDRNTNIMLVASNKMDFITNIQSERRSGASLRINNILRNRFGYDVSKRLFEKHTRPSAIFFLGQQGDKIYIDYDRRQTHKLINTIINAFDKKNESNWGQTGGFCEN